MQMLLDNKVYREKVESIKKYAQDNIYNFQNGIPKDHKPAGEDPNRVLKSGTTSIVYSIEDQPDIGLCHHISISKKGLELPSSAIVDEVLQHFGMRSLFASAGARRLWMEEEMAINIVEPMEKK